MRILFTGDLHLSKKDKDYSFSVLEEIILSSLNYDMLIFLGDTFDTFEDLQSLREYFKKYSEKSDAIKYLIIGNHEKIGAPKDFDFNSLNLGKSVCILDEEPYSVIKKDGVEIIALSYKEKYEEYTKWHAPVKTSLRFLLMHGILENTMYFSDENDIAAIPKNIASLFEPDMMMFGHIHQNIDKSINIDGKNINLIYPGSARICRNSKSESGQRLGVSVCIEDRRINVEYIIFKSAGKYERYNISINGKYIDEINKLSLNWEENDIVDIYLFGLIENDTQFEKIKNEIISEYKNKVREFNVKNGETFFIANIESEKIISEYIYIADSMKDKYESEYIEAAKIIGIEKIARAINGRG